MDALTGQSATTLAQMIRQKKISPVELVQAHLERIERLNPKLNAFVSINAEGALRAARAGEEAVSHGRELGPLHGVPVTVKSSIDVAGLRCECGTRLRVGYIPAEDAPLVRRLRATGAIIVGNTNVPEMLMAYETENPLHGRTHNPWDLARTPGGSSGGEAAAIAAGCSAAGVGSDGGGSIRVPAHFTGICGLKPTPGRIPATGHFPPSLGPFALLGVVGPMARTVGDLRLLFKILAGPDKGDTCASPVPLREVSQAEIRKFRIGYFEDDGRTPVSPETRAAIRSAAAALRSAGFEIEPFRPDGLEDARRLWEVFFCVGAALALRPLMAGAERELPILQEFLRSTAGELPLTRETFFNAWIERDLLRSRLLAQMEQFPLLLCPISSVPAFRHGERQWTIEGQTVRYLDAMSYTQWFNLLGNPAAVVPVSRSREGLPIGVQVAGRPYEEEVVLAVAEKLEQIGGGWQEPPLGALGSS